jgi:hypothetical protein
MCLHYISSGAQSQVFFGGLAQGLDSGK